MNVDIVRDFPDATWAAEGPTRAVEPVLEAGGVLRFPHLAFALHEGELKFLDPRWADGKAKNISLRWPGGELRGAGHARALSAPQASSAFDRRLIAA